MSGTSRCSRREQVPELAGGETRHSRRNAAVPGSSQPMTLDGGSAGVATSLLAARDRSRHPGLSARSLKLADVVAAWWRGRLGMGADTGFLASSTERRPRTGGRGGALAVCPGRDGSDTRALVRPRPWRAPCSYVVREAWPQLRAHRSPPGPGHPKPHRRRWRRLCCNLLETPRGWFRA